MTSGERRRHPDTLIERPGATRKRPPAEHFLESTPRREQEQSAPDIPVIKEMEGVRYTDVQPFVEGGMGALFLAKRHAETPEGSESMPVIIKTIRLDILRRAKALTSQESNASQQGVSSGASTPILSKDVPHMLEKMFELYMQQQREVEMLQTLAPAFEGTGVRITRPVEEQLIELRYPNDDIECLGIVMEYVHGDDVATIFETCESLRHTSSETLTSEETDLLAQWPPTEGSIMYLAERLATILRVMHKAGVSHRDIKLANVMLDTDGVFVLGDFGLAKQFDARVSDLAVTDLGISHTALAQAEAEHAAPLPKTKQQYRPSLRHAHPAVSIEKVPHTKRPTPELKKRKASSLAVGTPQYMAPEEFLPERKNSPARDLYSLGVFLYMFQAKETPFQRQYTDMSMADAMTYHYKTDPPVLRMDLYGAVEQTPMEALTYALIARKPQDRKTCVYRGVTYPISSAEELLSTLGALQKEYRIHPDDSLFRAYNAYKKTKTMSS